MGETVNHPASEDADQSTFEVTVIEKLPAEELGVWEVGDTVKVESGLTNNGDSQSPRP